MRMGPTQMPNAKATLVRTTTSTDIVETFIEERKKQLMKNKKRDE